MHSTTESKVSTVATFPPGFFLENIVALSDDSLLVTVANRKELYCIPPPTQPGLPRSPILLERFGNDAWAFGMALAPHNPNLVYLLTTDFTSQGSCTHHIRLLNMSNVANACHSTVLAQFPASAKGLNGLVALSDSVLLAADSFAGCIWRVDIRASTDGLPTDATITEWLRDPSFDGTLVLPDFQPGVNGLKYSSVAQVVCFSSTQQRIFAKIRVDPESFGPVGPVVILHNGAQGDDFLIDDDFAGGPVAYLATHRDNSILRIQISDNNERSNGCHVVAAGEPDDYSVLGPTAGAWRWGCKGKTAFFTCDGGLKNPPPGETPRYARVLQLDFYR